MKTSVNLWTQEWARKNNLSVHFTNSTNSTNTWAKDAFTGPASAVFLADEQTHGRGRNSNTWQMAQPGDGLLSTWCFQIQAPPPVVFPIRVGWNIYKALKTAWPETAFALKAPNDIYIDDNKVAGVLVEVVSAQKLNIFIGLGLNVFSAPQGLDRATTALNNHTTMTQERWDHFCTTLQDSFNEAVLKKDQELSISECLHINQALSAFYGTKFDKIQPDGSLIFSDGTITFWRDL